MTDNPLEGVDWGSRRTAADGFLVDVSIRFEAGRVSGSTGCNRYTGSCAVGEGTLEFGSIGRRGWPALRAVMEVEADVFARLGRSTRWELEPTKPTRSRSTTRKGERRSCSAGGRRPSPGAAGSRPGSTTDAAAW